MSKLGKALLSLGIVFTLSGDTIRVGEDTKRDQVIDAMSGVIGTQFGFEDNKSIITQAFMTTYTKHEDYLNKQEIVLTEKTPTSKSVKDLKSNLSDEQFTYVVLPHINEFKQEVQSDFYSNLKEIHAKTQDSEDKLER